jgi:hypothetical protein
VTTVEALQAALAAENATIYGYGVAGARLKDADQTYAITALTTHLHQRDRLIALVLAAHATPVAALPAYRMPFGVRNQTEARQLAAHLEQGIAGTCWDLVAASAPASPTRSLAVTWLGDAALRTAYWGATQALPGQPA